jgi:hypothetical protein
MKRGQEVAREGIIFSQKTLPSHQTMVPSLTKHPLLNWSCLPPPRLRLEHYTSMHKKGSKSVIFWRRWYIHNPPLPSKQIIRQRTASSTYVFNQNAQKPWTCVSIGCGIGASIKTIQFYWRPGTSMRADYWTKHHPPSHHRNMRSEILTPYKVVLDLRRKMAKMQ